MDAVRLENVSKRYNSGRRSVTVLSNINISVKEGSTLLLRGASGAGKSTLLSIMGCLLYPTSGCVFIHRKSVTRIPEHFLCRLRRNEIGFVFQQFNLINGLSLLENVVMPLIPMNISPKEQVKRGEKLLSLLSLRERMHFDVNELSGGEQQRAAIARALINNPGIILADEPTSNIDPDTTSFIINLFKKFKHSGKTIVISSHDPRIVESELPDKVFNLDCV